MNKVLLQKLLSTKGIVINEDEKKANVLHNFGLNPLKSHEDGGKVSEAGVSEGNTSITEDTISRFNLK